MAKLAIYFESERIGTSAISSEQALFPYGKPRERGAFIELYKLVKIFETMMINFQMFFISFAQQYI
jgi:hypothetical protein